MSVLVVFPRPSVYEGKGIDAQRIMRKSIVKYLTMIKDANVKVEYFIEDRLAHNFIKQVGISNVRLLTSVCQKDSTVINKYPLLYDNLPEDYGTLYNLAEYVAIGFDSLYIPDFELMLTDMKSYQSKEVDGYYRRVKEGMQDYINKSMTVFNFRADNNSDRCKKLQDTVVIGDGRLCVDVSLNSNLTTVYYGGVYITEDNIPVILSLEGGTNG